MSDTTTSGAAGAAPLSQEWVLACGVRARFEMPDLFAFADGSFEIPNDAQAAVYKLIYGDGGAEVAPMAQLHADRERLRGLVALFTVVCASPRVVIDDEARQPGEIGPRQVAWTDLLAAYNFFRYGPSPFLPAAAAEEPGAGA